ncbi:MAG: ThuA domain-containing protein [Planctomycetes bacterium]|nr:ThuA domain-containing protein [Planctomycetota bacterium]
MRVLALATLAFALAPAATTQEPATPTPSPWVEYEGERGPGRGKHIVFVTGDEEYRSEEGMPQLARILALHHGFRCTVLFAIDPRSGAIDPDVRDNIPGLERLATADLMVLFTRFRDLPDAQMQHIVRYVESGKPIVGLRTATHAFRATKHRRYADYTASARWPGGFGRQVLGEKWIAHHGRHGHESARGILAPGAEQHPILRGIAKGSVWDPADVYRVRLPMLEGIRPLLLGQVLAGMRPDSPPLQKPADGKPDKNEPMMPIAWVREWSPSKDKRARVFATTLGSAQAFTQEGTRRLLVNACYWALGMDKQIPERAKVDLVGAWQPSPFGFKRFRKGVRPESLRVKAAVVR